LLPFCGFRVDDLLPRSGPVRRGGGPRRHNRPLTPHFVQPFVLVTRLRERGLGLTVHKTPTLAGAGGHASVLTFPQGQTPPTRARPPPRPFPLSGSSVRPPKLCSGTRSHDFLDGPRCAQPRSSLGPPSRPAALLTRPMPRASTPPGRAALATSRSLARPSTARSPACRGAGAKSRPGDPKGSGFPGSGVPNTHAVPDS
jgi:hypothetical protein